ncbi:MAG TPA: gephyrin-like molybdotransferase Glp [Bryobacteraceae bacterium]|nr:gephyrin-like molybdotransferase Glp [Bryobacteraceae bacterium]
MITPEEAWAILGDHVRPLKAEAVQLEAALGRWLAGDVRADRDLPPADRSARDGYAIGHADLERGPCVLRVAGEVAAGSPERPRVTAGTAVRVMTGANIPPGADTVVMVEQAEESGGLVTIKSPEAKGAHILRRGEDSRKGAVLLARGCRIGAGQVGVLAAVGKASVKVHRQPRIAVLCTGSELRRAGDRVLAHEIRDSNGPAVCAALTQWGFPGARSMLVADRRPALVAALRRALNRQDVVLFTGGVSAGAYDFVPDAIKAAGARIRFHKLRMRPGKPTLYATAPSNRHIFGLPGNPLSVFTALHEFALPALRRLAGCGAEESRVLYRLPLAEEAHSEGGWLWCKVASLESAPGGLAVRPVRSASSGDLVSAGRADGVILLPPERKRFAAGELVAFRPWRPLP